jgi:hypothetical protein|tara:strand:- start:6557 stop:6802 length:246 start_codon:yes stop_codon:yes gene_type:complete
VSIIDRECSMEYIEGIDNELKSIAFTFLDILRESGEINMMGAPRELREEFGIDKQVSFKLFEAWAAEMENDGADVNFNGEC